MNVFKAYNKPKKVAARIKHLKMMKNIFIILLRFAVLEHTVSLILMIYMDVFQI